MPSDYVKDLIDHKERVAKYMGIASDILYNHILPISVTPEAMGTLFEPVIIATNYEQNGTAPFQSLRPQGQMIDMCANTMAYFCRKEVYDVGWMRYAISDLFHRAAIHDNSKFSDEEYNIYEQLFPDLQKYAYGTPEYKATVKLLGPAWKHHCLVNDHHPEYFKRGVADMHGIQQIEMCCDWCAASDRSQTPIEEGLEKNKERFQIDDYLYPFIKNTVILLKEEAH